MKQLFIGALIGSSLMLTYSFAELNSTVEKGYKGVPYGIPTLYQYSCQDISYTHMPMGEKAGFRVVECTDEGKSVIRSLVRDCK